MAIKQHTYCVVRFILHIIYDLNTKKSLYKHFPLSDCLSIIKKKSSVVPMIFSQRRVSKATWLVFCKIYEEHEFQTQPVCCAMYILLASWFWLSFYPLSTVDIRSLVPTKTHSFVPASNIISRSSLVGIFHTYCSLPQCHKDQPCYPSWRVLIHYLQISLNLLHFIDRVLPL